MMRIINRDWRPNWPVSAAYAACTLATLALSTTDTLAASPLRVWKNRYEFSGAAGIQPSFSYFSTNTNFLSDGSQVMPRYLNRYTLMRTDLDLSYGIAPYLTVYGQASWAAVNLDYTLQPGNTFGFADQTLGFTVHVWEYRPKGRSEGQFPILAVDLQGEGSFPAYRSREPGSTVPTLGDGSVDVTGGIFLTMPIIQDKSRALLLSAGGGYTYRSAGFSAALPWSTGLKFQPTERGFFLSAMAYGSHSLKTDSRTATASSIDFSNNGSGGSFMVSAINPSLVNIKGEVGYRITRGLGFYVGATRTLVGMSAPVGMELSVGLQARLGTLSKNPAELNPLDYGKSNRGFVNYAFEAKVQRVNDRLNQIRIDKGSQDGVEMGQVFDIFLVKQDGSVGAAVARAKCTSVQLTEASLTITEYFSEVWIEEGFVAKRPLN